MLVDLDYSCNPTSPVQRNLLTAKVWALPQYSQIPPAVWLVLARQRFHCHQRHLLVTHPASPAAQVLQELQRVIYLSVLGLRDNSG